MNASRLNSLLHVNEHYVYVELVLQVMWYFMKLLAEVFGSYLGHSESRTKLIFVHDHPRQCTLEKIIFQSPMKPSTYVGTTFVDHLHMYILGCLLQDSSIDACCSRHW
jgi:drug/metabolite transporter superfamily protein YnfA